MRVVYGGGSLAAEARLYTAPIATRPLTTPRAEQRRRELLAAAVEVFSDNDYDEVSADAVAALAGVSHGLVFQYFGSKKELYVAAVDAILEQFRQGVLTPPARGSTSSWLKSSLAVYVDWAAAHPTGYRSLMRAASGMNETRERVEASRWRGLEPIAVGFGLDLADPRVRIALRGWIGFMEAAILTWLDEGSHEREALLELLVRTLLDATAGLRGP